jgi:CheY-like chemotaxis protein
MNWQGRRRSTNVEDRRGTGGRRGGGSRIAVGGGLGGVALIVLYLLFGGDLGQLLGGDGAATTTESSAESSTALSTKDVELGEFVKVVLADIEDTWSEQFTSMGRTYREPKLVLFTGSTRSGCGTAGSSVGPFYCPGDSKVYLDLAFFEDMQRSLGAPGDFALAYVIAHEVGHHVQNLLGVMDDVQAAQQRASEKQANDLSVRSGTRRLPGRRVGPLRPRDPGLPRRGGHRGGSQRRERGRRRPYPEAPAGVRGPRCLHARHLGAARTLVPQGAGNRRHRAGRHVRRRPALKEVAEAPMPLSVVVQSPTHLVRQPVAQSLAALGLSVHEFSDLGEAVARLNELSPDLVVVDADGAGRQWRTLVAGLGGTSARVGVVLLSGRVSFDDAHDAQSLGVAGIIKKPFRGADHAARIVDAALARRGLRARRAHPRCRPDGVSDAVLEIALPEGDERLVLWDISNVGAGVAVATVEARWALRAGEYFPAATIDWGGTHLELSLRVAHVTGDVAGLQFISVTDGARHLARTITERFARAIGPLENRNRW